MEKDKVYVFEGKTSTFLIPANALNLFSISKLYVGSLYWTLVLLIHL